MTQAIDLPDWVTVVGGPTQLVWSTFITTTDIPVAQFSSVIVRLANLDGTTPLVARYSFRGADGLTVDQGVLSADAVTGAPTWTLPVLGPTLRLENLTGGNLIARVTGLPIARNKRMMFDYLPAREFSATIPNGTASLTFTQLPGSGTSGDAAFADLSSYNGLCTYIYKISTLGGTTSVELHFETRHLDGTTEKIQLNTTTSNQPVVFQAGHPFGFVTWWARNNGATTANIVTTLSIIPAENV